MLMLRLLEALGYECRWVVDWSDHVWVEARVGERWVHVDPCEVRKAPFYSSVSSLRARRIGISSSIELFCAPGHPQTEFLLRGALLAECETQPRW